MRLFSQALHKFPRHLDCHNMIDQPSEVNRNGMQYSYAILWAKPIPFLVPGLWQTPQDALRLKKAVKIYSQFRYEATSSFVWDPCVIEIHVMERRSDKKKWSVSYIYYRNTAGSRVITNMHMRKVSLHKQRSPIHQHRYSQFALTKHTYQQNSLYSAQASTMTGLYKPTRPLAHPWRVNN